MLLDRSGLLGRSGAAPALHLNNTALYFKIGRGFQHGLAGRTANRRPPGDLGDRRSRAGFTLDSTLPKGLLVVAPDRAHQPGSGTWPDTGRMMPADAPRLVDGSDDRASGSVVRTDEAPRAAAPAGIHADLTSPSAYLRPAPAIGGRVRQAGMASAVRIACA